MKRILFLMLPVLLAAAPADARPWTIGPNLDFGTRVDDHDGGSVTTLGLPAGVLGLRVGFPGSNAHFSTFFDGGLSVTTGGGARSNHYALTGNLQWAVVPDADLTPYLNAGFGFRHISYRTTTSANATSIAWGGGIGLRQKWGESAYVRGEVRVDRVTQGDDGSVTVIPGGAEYGFRLGFDLRVR